MLNVQFSLPIPKEAQREGSQNKHTYRRSHDKLHNLFLKWLPLCTLVYTSAKLFTYSIQYPGNFHTFYDVYYNILKTKSNNVLAIESE